MKLGRRLLLQTAAVGVPAAVLGGYLSRTVGDSEPALAAATAVDCQSGTGRVIYWGEQRNTNVPSASYEPWESLMPPVPRTLQSGVTAVAAAAGYVLALKGGRVYSIGDCGCVGSTWEGNRVWNVPPAATAGVTAIAAGVADALALRDGRVIAWGQSTGIGEIPEAALSGVSAIACSGYALAVKNGAVIQWDVASGFPAVPDAAKSGVVAVSASGFHALALREDGSVVAWGISASGAAIQVPAEARSGVTAIAAGGKVFGDTAFSLAVKDGRVFGWGANNRGQLSAPEVTDVTAIAAGSHNGVLLTKQGAVEVWGISQQRQAVVPDEVCKASAISIGGYMCAAVI
jgi:alpha-tubulin suppressor-like RCC1 family protein